MMYVGDEDDAHQAQHADLYYLEEISDFLIREPPHLSVSVHSRLKSSHTH
eukprot:CAMPEP_0114172070 /NCGR_PEP_ID=MMETSP0043_2-20121206/35052_1 /TAXON_ID=464988 /ORGANISM="Hemiselmis andersenii, Strain CCMP644" /LENGTH=49 /DNA_ID= /DNA_START= /DNA_END= /DNA_ORIENTATION=